MASCDDLFEEAIRAYGAALDRLARAYEADAESRRDLLQEIHFALWRSFESFDARCSLRTWVYRVAHNVGASHVARDRRAKARPLISVDSVEIPNRHRYGSRPESSDRSAKVVRVDL
jgi:RNA polymerase sigma-70 factor (ECF subfamily)